MYRVLYIPGGCLGFQPSTVPLESCESRFWGSKKSSKKLRGLKFPKNDLNTSYLGSSLQLKNHPKWPESFHSSHGKTSPMTDRYTAVFNHDYGRKSILARIDRQGVSGSPSWKRYIHQGDWKLSAMYLSEPQVYKSWCNIIHMLLLGALAHFLHLLRACKCSIVLRL